MVGLALLALCLLIAGCTRPPNREFLLDGSTDCEARDCGCGTIEVSTASGDAIEIAGELVRTFVLEGTLVVAEAQPEPGWVFSHWSGDLAGENSAAEVLADGGKSIVAHFERKSPLRTLGIRLIGEGGIDAGLCVPMSSQLVGGRLVTPRSALFGDGETVHLTAYDAPGWHFESWSGFETGVSEIELTMDRDRSLTVLFVDEHDHD